jgi:hypothetical protein
MSLCKPNSGCFLIRQDGWWGFQDLLQRLDIYFLIISQFLIALESYVMEIRDTFKITHEFQVTSFYNDNNIHSQRVCVTTRCTKLHIKMKREIDIHRRPKYRCYVRRNRRAASCYCCWPFFTPFSHRGTLKYTSHDSHSGVPVCV